MVKYGEIIIFSGIVLRINQVILNVYRINEERKEVLNGTGMYVVTFTLPSGYTIDQKQATNDNPSAKLVELEGEDVTGYFDEV